MIFLSNIKIERIRLVRSIFTLSLNKIALVTLIIIL